MVPTEFQEFRELARCDIRLWPKFNLFNAYPTEQNVMSLLAEHGMQNIALLARRGSLKATGHKYW